MSDEQKKQEIVFVILAGTVLFAAHDIVIRAAEDFAVAVGGTDSFDMAAEVLVGAGRPDILPRLEHLESIKDEDKGERTVNVRYNPIGQRMIQEKEQAKAEHEHIAAAQQAEAEKAANEENDDSSPEIPRSDGSYGTPKEDAPSGEFRADETIKHDVDEKSTEPVINNATAPVAPVAPEAPEAPAAEEPKVS